VLTFVDRTPTLTVLGLRFQVIVFRSV
jgi:hypothetical protein